MVVFFRFCDMEGDLYGGHDRTGALVTKIAWQIHQKTQKDGKKYG